MDIFESIEKQKNIVGEALRLLIDAKQTEIRKMLTLIEEDWFDTELPIKIQQKYQYVKVDKEGLYLFEYSGYDESERLYLFKENVELKIKEWEAVYEALIQMEKDVKTQVFEYEEYLINIREERKEKK